ncbi:transcriptional coactivator/pterin dehydratase, partial [Coccomyxa subellipsoidea C-169]
QAEGWDLAESEQKHLLIRRTFRTKNFVKALELCNRFGEVAEAEGHHPDLHITGWNRLTVELTTHSRDGLTENDFIMAAKLNAVPKDDLLSKKKA